MDIARHTSSRSQIIPKPLLAFALLAIAILFAAPATIFAQAQTADQQSCSNDVEKSFGKTVKAVGKGMCGCMKDISKSKAGTTCFGSDAKGKVAKATAATEAAHTATCYGNAPDFGFAGAGIANENAVLSDDQLLAIMFGSELTTALPIGGGTAELAKCQQSVAKAVKKCRDTRLKNYAGCKKKALKGGAADQASISACVIDDSKGKIAKTCDQTGAKVDKIRATVAKKCVGVDLSVAFPGCGTADAEVLHACIEDQEACKTCGMAAAMAGDDLAIDCDSYDNEVGDNSCRNVAFEKVSLPSDAEPAQTPGTAGVVVTNPDLITQFGGAGFSLNNATYTRWRLAGPEQQPDAVFIVIAGFGGDSNNFQIMIEDLIPKVWADHGLVLEMWAYHRRENQLEDVAGMPAARRAGDELAALDFAFGAEMGFTMHPLTASGVGRRAVYYNSADDIPFLAQWTGQVASRDLDAIVEHALTIVSNGNVFMGGHSAGTGYTARYAATDFNLTGVGPAEPGYAKLRGLLMFEGGAGSTGGAALTSDSLDRMIAKFDGGLFGAVRDNAPRCVDGTTPCTVATEAVDCSGQTPPVCTEPVAAYSAVGGIGPEVGAVAAIQAIQGVTDQNSGLSILQQDFSGADSSALDVVSGLSLLGFLPDSTVAGITGQFLDDEGAGVVLSPAVATSLGVVNSFTSPVSWTNIDDPLLPPAATPDNGPAPTTLPAGHWGVEQEVVKMDRFLRTFLAGDANASDWYFATSGLGVTSAPGVCAATVCTTANVGASCANNGDCAQSISLDSSALSVGLGRRDIVNLTQAGNIDIPVICIGGSNGLTPVGASYLSFGSSIATCTAPSCTGQVRVVDDMVPSAAFPTYGDVDGGYEVHIIEGLAHNDVTTAEDIASVNILTPLAEFLARNVQ